MMDLKMRRKDWPILFSEESPAVRINEWIKFFFVFWMTYLIYYTNNPISQFLYVSSKEYLVKPSYLLDLKVIAGGFLYFALIMGGVIWACGWKSIREFFPKFRLRSIPFTLIYTILVAVFTVIAAVVSVLVPTKLEANTSNSMQIAAYLEPRAFYVMAIRGFFTTLANVLISIMVFLMIYQLLTYFSKKYVRSNRVAAYIISGMIYGILLTRPDNPGLMQNIAFYAIVLLPSFWAYRRTRSTLIMTTSIWIVSQFTTLFILLANMYQP